MQFKILTWLFLIFVLLIHLGAASAPIDSNIHVQAATSCECEEIFRTLAAKLKENYIGYSIIPAQMLSC